VRYKWFWNRQTEVNESMMIPRGQKGGILLDIGPLVSMENILLYTPISRLTAKRLLKLTMGGSVISTLGPEQQHICVSPTYQVLQQLVPHRLTKPEKA
jgi:hypothetical protein